MPLKKPPIQEARESVHPDQTVSEMVEEVLQRQARALLQRSGCSLQKALEAVLRTNAGQQLSNLRDGPHAQQKVREWQENLLWERALERLGMVSYMEWLEGIEVRTESHALLEEEFASLQG